MDTALVWGILFCIFEMISMTIGSISIESPLFSCVSVAIHFVAAILLFFTIFDGWSYLTYTNYIFWYTSFVPFVLEVLLDIMSYRDTYLYIGKKIVELVRNCKVRSLEQQVKQRICAKSKHCVQILRFESISNVATYKSNLLILSCSRIFSFSQYCILAYLHCNIYSHIFRMI